MDTAPISIFLADLLHPANVMKTFPYAAGCVGAHVQEQMRERVRVRVFRAPEDLGAAFEADAPQILGLTNYVWNLELGCEVARRVRQACPRTVIVMGGPNYPADAAGQRAFLEHNPFVDFYVCKEGEVPFLDLVRSLEERGMDAGAIRSERLRIPGVHYMAGDELIAPPPPPRQRDLDAFASPYLSGLLDRFFERTDLAPIIQTKRGCPFECTFCVEGEDYYTRLASVSSGRVAAELEYIASRMGGGPPVLYVADSNFGMYEQDLEVCDLIADLRRRHGWPQTLEVSTGKNRKERVLEAVRRSEGAMRFGPSLQSTDPHTLENIKRSNISETVLMEMAAAAGDMGQRSFTELILALPGESPAAHLRSIRAAMEAGVQRIKMYSLVLLPGTEMASPQSRERFGLQTRFRVQPYCHGEYGFGRDSFACIEPCELVIGTDAMSFEEYLACKRFELSVEIFYNDLYLEEVHGLMRALGLPMFELVERCHARVATFPPELRGLYEALEQGVGGYLFETREACLEHFRDPARREEYARNEYRNSLGTLKAIALLEHIEPLLAAAREALHECIVEAGKDTAALSEYVDELFEYARLRRRLIMDTELVPEGTFHFEFERIRERQFRSEPAAFRLESARRMRFRHDAAQVRDLQTLLATVDSPIVQARLFLYPPGDPGVNPYLRRGDFC